MNAHSWNRWKWLTENWVSQLTGNVTENLRFELVLHIKRVLWKRWAYCIDNLCNNRIGRMLVLNHDLIDWLTWDLFFEFSKKPYCVSLGGYGTSDTSVVQYVVVQDVQSRRGGIIIQLLVRTPIHNLKLLRLSNFFQIKTNL